MRTKLGRIVAVLPLEMWDKLKIHFYLLICLFKPCCVNHVVLRRGGRRRGGEREGEGKRKPQTNNEESSKNNWRVSGVQKR